MRPSSAGAVALAYLAAEIREIHHREPEARDNAPDGVHKMRVASRRLRSALATYRPLFDHEVTEPLRGELKWLGSVLGEVRDVEVIRARLEAAATALPSSERVGPVLERIDAEMAWRGRDGHVRLLQELDGLRYRRLLDQLGLLVSEPPVTKRARRPAYRELRRRVRRTVRRVERAASRVPDRAGGRRDRALHEVRKAAKRARYAAESAALTLGRPADTLATRMEDLQKLLGEVQDGVAARAILRHIAITAHLAGEDNFTFGLLFAEQRGDADAVMADYQRVLRRALRATV